MELQPLVQTFVLHFGEMGRSWGINRTVGQIYALLFLSDRPLHAEEIAQALGVSRSNVSMGLKELQAWRLVRLQHLPGDRRDHFSTPEDLWEIVRTLAEERRKREIDPTLSLLRTVLVETPSSPAEAHAQGRMRELHDLIELLTSWSHDVQQLDNDRLVTLLRLGARVQRLLELKDRLTLIPGGAGRSRRARPGSLAAGEDLTNADRRGSKRTALEPTALETSAPYRSGSGQGVSRPSSAAPPDPARSASGATEPSVADKPPASNATRR